MRDIRCLKCGTLLLSGTVMEKLCDKIRDDKYSLAWCVVNCKKCFRLYGVVVASDSQMTMVLVVPPQRTNECFNELQQMLEQGLSIAAISDIVNYSKKPEYVNFL